MLRSLKDLDDFTISATDGQIGHIKDFYFDDDAWVIRYFVVDTGLWLTSRKVLISPIAARHPDWLGRSLPVALTLQQVKDSPGIDTDKPVSRQNEESYLGYYGYPSYWGGGGLWGEGLYPYTLMPGYRQDRKDLDEREREQEDYLRAERARHRNDDPHLRSCQAVTGYRIHATDGDIGHVAGLLVDDETWAVRYLVVETGHWWSGHQVLVAPEWIMGVQWTNETVAVDLGRESIKTAPPYDTTANWTHEQDMLLYRHYGRPAYWATVGLHEAAV